VLASLEQLQVERKMQPVEQKHRSINSLTLTQPSISVGAALFSLLYATRVFFGVICHPRVRVTEVRHRHQLASRRTNLGVHHESTSPLYLSPGLEQWGEGTGQGFLPPGASYAMTHLFLLSHDDAVLMTPVSYRSSEDIHIPRFLGTSHHICGECAQRLVDKRRH
jgi:hypothetical protein